MGVPEIQAWRSRPQHHGEPAPVGAAFDVRRVARSESRPADGSAGGAREELALEPVPEIALDRGGTDAFPAPQTAAVNPVQVLLIDGLLKGLAGTLALFVQRASTALDGSFQLRR